MSEPHAPQKYALTCLRMAQECRGLAAAVPDADQRAYFLRMAGMAELAVRPREVD